MDKYDFISAMLISKPPYQNMDVDYSNISCIPKEIADAQVYEAWYGHAVDVCRAGADTAFGEIPVEFVTDGLRRKAIFKSVRSLIFISPEHTDSYKDLVLLGLQKTRMAFMMMHDSLKTLDFLKEIVEKVPGVLDFNWGSQEWVRDVMTEDLKDKILQTNLRFGLSLSEGQVSQKQWDHLFTTQQEAAVILEEKDLLPLYIQFLREGGWPKYPSGKQPERPVSLEAAAEMLMARSANRDFQPPDPVYLIYKAKLMSFPIEDVIPVMNSADRLEILMSIYPENSLRKHMKLSRGLRGALLENDLGM